jgi:Fe-S-cluster containining protein
MDCKCDVCTSACRKKPGWFKPGEVAKAAALLNMSEQAFFDRYVSIDYYCMGNDFIFVLAPATLKIEPRALYPLNPTGECRFLQNGLCSIHDAKPYECGWYDHTQTDEVVLKNEHLSVALAWKGHQDEIERLLGRKPEVEIPSERQQLDFMLDMLCNSLGIFTKQRRAL